MRRRLALLVAATTSVVLLAFTLPLAVQIDHAATNAAITSATDRSQRIVPTVADGSEAEIRQEVATVSDPDYVVRVRLPSGTVVGRPFRTSVPPVDPDLRATAVRVLGDGRVILDQPVVREDGTAVISTLMSEAVLDAGVWRSWAILGGLAVTLFVLSLVVADRLARSMTRPVTELAETAERLGHGDLTARVEPSGPDEVREVGQALNRLAARIGELLTNEREAVADLSHRLRTPVTALRLDVESLPRGPDRDRLTADVDEMTRQIDVLIREARRPVREGVEARSDACAVVRERVEFWQALAEEQGRRVGLSLPGHPCPVRAGAADLEAALDALLGNVIAHTPDGTALDVTVTVPAAGGAVVTVCDDGPGISDSTVLARGSSPGGSTGLGLDIARRTATASGGQLAVDRSPSGGTRVVMQLGPPAGDA